MEHSHISHSWLPVAILAGRVILPSRPIIGYMLRKLT